MVNANLTFAIKRRAAAYPSRQKHRKGVFNKIQVGGVNMAAANEVALDSIIIENKQEFATSLHDFVSRNDHSGHSTFNFNRKQLSVASKAVHSIRHDIQTITVPGFLVSMELFQSDASKR